MAFYWNEADRIDQENRRLVNAGRTYTDNARCNWCKDQLDGEFSECPVCKALLCPTHSCVDGRCPEHTGSGEYLPRED
jgi:hypothetical protein